MRKTLKIGCLICLLLLSQGMTVAAQDLGTLLEAVEKIENNLKDLIKQEATLRSQQITKLESAIAKNQKSTKSLVNKGISEEQLLAVITELSELREQVAEFEKYFESHGTQFASANNAGSEVADKRAEELDAKLEALSHNVQGLIDGDHGPVKKHKSDDKHAKTAIHGKLYGHAFANMTDNESSHGEFAMSRAYFTVKSKISESSAVRVTTDLKTIDDKYNIILKYAYFDWKPSFANGIVGLRFGLQPTEYIDYMNKLWGRRYAAPTIGDLHHFLTTSDLGVSTTIGFGPHSEFGFVKLSLLNGTSYSHVEEHNSSKDFNVVALVTPFKDSHNFKKSSLLMQFYTGTQNEDLHDLETIDTSGSPWDTTHTSVSSSDWKRQIFSVGGAFVWDHTVDVGFDLNFVTLGHGAGHSPVKKQGLSFFGAYYLYKLSHNSFLKNLGLIGRVDFYDPDKSESNNSETLTVFGIESKPMYSLKVALNYRITSHQDDHEETNSTLYLNTLFKF